MKFRPVAVCLTGLIGLGLLALSILIQRFDASLVGPDPSMSTPEVVYLIGFPPTDHSVADTDQTRLTDGLYVTRWQVNEYTGETARLEVTIHDGQVVKKLMIDNYPAVTGTATAQIREGIVFYHDVNGPAWMFPKSGEVFQPTESGLVYVGQKQNREFIWLATAD